MKEKQAKYYMATRPEMASFIVGRPFRILEIGCGEGLFRRNIAWPNEYWGIELIDKVAEKAKSELDHVIVGDVNTVCGQIPDGYFDLIVCNDVIEHLQDTNGFFSLARRKLAEQGQLVASVPNVRCISNLMNLLVFKDWRYTSEGILDDTHLRFFTRKSFVRICRESDFDIEKAAMVNQITSLSIIRPLSWMAALAALFMGRDIRYQNIAVRLSKKNQVN